MARKKDNVEFKFKSRAYSMILFVVLIYSFLIYRLANIQVIDSDIYKDKMISQNTYRIDLNSGRGTIYDRNGKALTDTVKTPIIVAEKKKLFNDIEYREAVKNASKIDEIELFKHIEEQKESSFIEIETEKLDDKTKLELKDKGLIVEEKIERYSSDRLLSHTIGYIKKADKTGVSGIEKSMEDVLHNSNEKYISAFRAGDKYNLGILKGSVKTINESIESKNVKLTIDKDIQKSIENILNKEENPSAVVISDVDTGEILSIASRPTFNPSDLLEGSEIDDGKFTNRALQRTYPPGSVFKIVVLYAALENKIIDDDYTYNCVGHVNTGGNEEVLKCNNLQGHGIQTLQQAFSNSCNTAFYDIALKVGEENIIKAAEKLHLDEKIDIGIDEEKNRELPNDIAMRNLAIGQGDLEFTPLQINQMTQIIANNGTYKPLFLYDSIIDNKKNMIKGFRTSKEEEIISPYTITRIKEMMKDVSKNGTAKDLLDLSGGSGVKTGTAQSVSNGNKVNHGWITGYYPENSPKYAITVFVEGMKDSNKSAIPIFKEICQKLSKK